MTLAKIWHATRQSHKLGKVFIGVLQCLRKQAKKDSQIKTKDLFSLGAPFPPKKQSKTNKKIQQQIYVLGHYSKPLR